MVGDDSCAATSAATCLCTSSRSFGGSAPSAATHDEAAISRLAICSSNREYSAQQREELRLKANANDERHYCHVVTRRQPNEDVNQRRVKLELFVTITAIFTGVCRAR